MPVPQVIAPTGDVTLTAGSEILIATTTAIAAPRGASVYPFVYGAIAVLMGASAPATLTFAFRFNGGADIATYAVAPAALGALATVIIPVFFVGVRSISSWASPGQIVEVTGAATTNAATAKQVGTALLVGLALGPD
jgi:hypothetical protein